MRRQCRPQTLNHYQPHHRVELFSGSFLILEPDVENLIHQSRTDSEGYLMTVAVFSCWCLAWHRIRSQVMTDASLRAGTNTSAFWRCPFLRYSIYPRFASHANLGSKQLLCVKSLIAFVLRFTRCRLCYRSPCDCTTCLHSHMMGIMDQHCQFYCQTSRMTKSRKVSILRMIRRIWQRRHHGIASRRGCPTQ